MEPATQPRPIDDLTLVSRMQDGDRTAFADLVDRYKDPLVAYLGRLTGDPCRAEDLAQETFVRFFVNASRYREQGRLLAYLYRIATNLLRSELRRERRWRLLAPLVGHHRQKRQEPSQQEGVLQREAGRRLRQALTRVPLSFRVPLVLHELQGWPYRRIAAHLELAEGTVKSRIHRGRVLLRGELEDYWNGVES